MLTNDLKLLVNQQTNIILRPDATLTVVNFRGNGRKGANQNFDPEEESNESHAKNKKIDGYLFGHEAKRRLKNYVVSAAINGKLDNKNAMFATFTFTNSPIIKEYNPAEHDDLLGSTFQAFVNNLKVNHGLKDYVFVAERHTGKRTQKGQKGQTSHKNWLHYHTILIFDSFFDVKKLNYLWLKKINSHEKLRCEFATKATLEKTVSLVNENNKSFIRANFNNPRYRSSANIIYDFVPDYYLPFVQEGFKQNDLRTCNTLAYDYIDESAINTLSGYLVNPVDVEFFSEGKNNNQLTKQETIRKVVSYITTYISKADNGTDITTFEGNNYIIEHRLYTRIWSASRLFTSQKHKVNITFEQFQEMIDNKVVKIVESSFDITDTDTGEIREIPVYTVVFDFEIYQNQTYVNYFKNEETVLPQQCTDCAILQC